MKTTAILFCLLLASTAFSESSIDKIKKAYTDKIIEYPVYMGLTWISAFDQNSLPPQFKSDDTAEVEIDLAEASQQIILLLPQMPVDLAKAVYRTLIPKPFLRLPNKNKENFNKDDDFGFEQPLDEPNAEWEYLDSIFSGIRVWYLKNDDSQRLLAAKIMGETSETIVPKLKGLMGRSHVGDGQGSWQTILVQTGIERKIPNGGDDKLDIYLVLPSHNNKPPLGKFYTNNPEVKEGCAARSGQILINAAWAKKVDEKKLRSVVAHEYMHALQFAFNRKYTCSIYADMGEGVSDWAMHYVYETDNFEHGTGKAFSSNGKFALSSAAYDSWPFFFYVAKVLGSARIREIYQATQERTAMQAIDETLDGGFEKQWIEYAKYEWNQEPLEESFFDWDKYSVTPGRGDKNITDKVLPPLKFEEVKLNSDGQFRYEMKLDLDSLTRDYYPFVFKDDNVRSVAIYNPVILGDRKVNAKVLIRKKGSSKFVEEEWTDTQKRIYLYCRDKKDQQIEELVIVIANYSYGKDSKNYTMRPILSATNQACHELHGQMTENTSIKNRGVEHHLNVTAKDLIFRENGLDKKGYFRGGFSVVSGQVNYTYKGSLDKCTGSASGALQVAKYNRTKADVGIAAYNAAPEPWGEYSIGLRLEEGFFNVTYTCPDGTEVVVPYYVDLNTSLNPAERQNHKGSATLKGSTSFQGISRSWELQPVSE